MTDVSLVPLQQLAAARDKAYANAARPGLSDADANAWEKRGDKLEVQRQQLAAKLIDDGSAVYHANQPLLTDAQKKLQAAVATLDALTASLKAFDDLIAVLTKVAALAVA
jgi:hypothetical protein